MRRVVWVIVVMVMCAGFSYNTVSLVEATSSKTLLIPLYSYPGCQWDKLVNLRHLYGISIVAIVNPNNGPGSKRDSNYSSYIVRLKDAGIRVIGYVWTNYGSRNITEVEKDVDKWISWYNVDGIFFDEVSTSSSEEEYYRTLVNYLKNKSQNYIAVGNPGVYEGSAVLDYASIFDVLVVYDNEGYPLSWPNGPEPSKLGALVYGVQEFNKEEFLDLAEKAHYLYVTDDNGNNPWDELASYIADEAAVLAGVQKINYALRIRSQDSSTHSIVEHYPEFRLTNGNFYITYSVFIKNWSEEGVYPMYVTFNNSAGNEVAAYFYWGNGWNGTALYACYISDCTPTNFDPTRGWLTLSIVATPSSLTFYVEGTNVKSLDGLSLDSVLRIDAGSWDSVPRYTMYIDNVTEIKGGEFIKENFDCAHDCYFTVHEGDVDVVLIGGTSEARHFLLPLPHALVVLLSLLIVAMRRK